MRRLLLAVFATAPLLLPADRFAFRADEAAEAVAELDLRSPGADWAVPGKEAAIATVLLDGKSLQHVILYGGPELTTYRVFLGAVDRGTHHIAIGRDEKFSAVGAGLEVVAVRFRVYGQSTPEYDVMALAPVLYARLNTVGHFSDIPLIVYCERKAAGLQYTVIFSNEDGGTSTRALMARWGRTTDIEYVYDFTSERSVVQGPGHKDVEFRGPYDGSHPLLMPVTDNNMIARAQNSPLRFQIAPVLVDLSGVSRESVMDRYPVTYTVMTKELEREGKLRPYGVVQGEKISDQRNYLFVDFRALHRSSRFRVQILLQDGQSFASDLGRFDYAIGRDGSVRTTVELPPSTSASEIVSIGFDCLAAESDQRVAHDGVCRLEAIHRVFFLGRDGQPGPDLIKANSGKTIPSGRSIWFRP